jgi:hypothetical protein
MNCGVLQEKIGFGQDVLGPMNGFQHGTILIFPTLCNQRNLKLGFPLKPRPSTEIGKRGTGNLFQEIYFRLGAAIMLQYI